MIRKATTFDLPVLESLIAYYAEQGLLLPLSHEQIVSRLRDFFVAEDQESGVTGCAALHLYSAELAEIRSLSVKPGFQRRGTGALLVRQCLEEAGQLKIARIFALTRSPEFFKKQGFREISKSALPEKVFKDCRACPRESCCDEIAVIRILTEDAVPVTGGGTY